MKKSFVKPSEEEIKTYLQLKNYQPETAKTFAEKFWNYYESCGWMVGKKPMVSWHAAIRTWELNNRNYESNRTNFKQPDNRQGTSVARIEALRNW